MRKQRFIEQVMVDQIQRGVFYPGDRVPTIRKVAEQYHVSITPVTEAYQHLTELGILDHRPNVGYFVSEALEHDSRFSRAFAAVRPEPVPKERLLSSPYFVYPGQFRDTSNTSFPYPWGATAISMGIYPDNGLSAAVSRAFRSPLPQDNPQNMAHDNRTLVRGIVRKMALMGCSPELDEISIVASVTQGTVFALQVCTRDNRLVAIEAPGHNGFYFIAQALGLQVVRVPSDFRTGLKVDAFRQMLQYGIQPACLLLSSTFASPTGAQMPDRNKADLVELCRGAHIPIVEDDAMGDLYFGENRPIPLKALDPENVIYLSGFGKTIAPSLRVGWMAGGRMKEQLDLHKTMLAGFLPDELQAGLASYLDSPACGRCLQQLRTLCKTASEGYCALIRESFPPGTVVHQPAGGVFLWIQLPPAYQAKEICYELQRKGVFLLSGSMFSSDMNDFQNCIRLNVLALPWTQENQNVLRQVGRWLCTLQ